MKTETQGLAGALHFLEHTPAVVTLSLLIRAQVNGKHVLILRELFPTLLSPRSSPSLWPCLPPPLPPLFDHPPVTLLGSQALKRKRAAGGGVYVIQDRSMRLVLEKETLTKAHAHFLIRAHLGDENCPCPAGTPSTPPLLT